MTMSDIKRSLKLFNEKADSLANSSFFKIMCSSGTGVTIKYRKGEPISVVRRGPGDEQVKAFVLDFRFFIQDNEDSSLHNMYKVYSSAVISDNLKQDFYSSRDSINGFLDSSSSIPVIYNSRLITNRMILGVFVYGGLAHANREKQALYKEWECMPPVYGVVKSRFASILQTVVRHILYIKGINEKALLELN